MNRGCLPAIMLAALSVGSLDTHAQNRCLQSDTIGDCWNRYLPAEVVPVEAREVADSLNSVETGIGAGNLASTVTNFLPLLRIAGIAGDGGEASDEQLLTLDLNFLIPGLGDNGQLQALINKDPKISEPLAMQLRAFMPDTEPADLLGRPIGDLDDYALKLTYGLANERFGRNLQQHRARFDNLVRAAIQQGREDMEQARFNLNAFRTVLQDPEFQEATANATDLEDLVFTDITNPDQRNAAMDAIERMAAAAMTTESAIAEHASALGVRDFAKLISNQPQLIASLRRDVREAYIGPEETSLELSYEFGFVNMNSFDKDSGGICDATDRGGIDIDAAVLACGNTLRAYVNDPGNRRALENGDRFSFSLSYSKVDEISFSLPTESFQYRTTGSHKVSAALAYGRLFGLGDGADDTRIDLEAKYEDASDDDTRNDRVIASMTLTRTVGNVSIPISLVYSNKPEFVIEGDAKLGAHIGIVFNTFGDSE